MSTLFIENGYCCGRGDIIYRLENWCLAHKIEYRLKSVRTPSLARYGEKSVILGPNLTLSEALRQLALPQSSQKR